MGERTGPVIGVDLGGTKLAAALVSLDGRLTHQVTRPTRTHDADALVDQVCEVVTELLAVASAPVRAVGIGAAGLVDRDRSTVRFAPNLPLNGVPLGGLVAMRTGLDVAVENDANAAAWAEYRFGAGRGLESLAVVTVGTGIGAGIVLDGRLFRGRHGLAAEVGHVVLDPAGPPCPCGGAGCLESFASGRALSAAARRLAGEGGAEIQGSALATAALAGDQVAIEAFRQIGTSLGLGLAGLAAVLDVDAFVLGGGVAAAGELLRAPAELALHDRLVGGAHRPRPDVRLAALGNEAGIVGAADLARVEINSPVAAV
jgi:glucokinase